MSAAFQLPLVEAPSKVTASSPFIVTNMMMMKTLLVMMNMTMRDRRYDWRKDK